MQEIDMNRAATASRARRLKPAPPLLAVLLSLVICSCASAQTIDVPMETRTVPLAEPETIAIGLAVGVERIGIRSASTAGLSAVSAEGVPHIVPPGEFVLAALDDKIAFFIDGASTAARSSSWTVAALDGDSLYCGDKLYRGALRVTKPGDTSLLTVANVIDVENYLRGVVSREMGFVRMENMEALKAQAVASRTYAVRNIGKRKALGFDLYSTSDDQNYGGVSAENAITDSAVKSTEGEIMAFDGTVLDAYYHSTCGGHTASLADVWSGDRPYLRGVSDMIDDTAACAQSRYYRWTERYSDSSLIALAGPVAKFGIAVLERDSSGRARRINIVRDDSVQVVAGDAIRRALKRNDGGMLRSTLVDVVPESGAIKLEGRGWGHGIGMCQMGAMGRCRRGWRYNQILMHYYPGASITGIKVAEKSN